MTSNDVQAGAGHWDSYERQWGAQIASPLRPEAADITPIEDCAAGLDVSRPGIKRAVLLGMTRDVAEMRWPAAFRLVAFDYARGRIESTWTATHPTIPAAAVCADWRAMPLPDRSVTLAAGDGSYNSVDSAASQDRVSRELVRVLEPCGTAIVRFYVRPDRAETLGAVFDALRAGRIGGVNALKLRLKFATPAAADGSMCLGDAWEYWNDAGFDRDALAARLEIGRAHV